ncbi:MAG: short-chain dehydrogenase/reductase [Acidobacteriaceae bacterium]|nr:short-chain dehydrogenase/reductase [Acidobacteriaceae bacterium]
MLKYFILIIVVLAILVFVRLILLRLRMDPKSRPAWVDPQVIMGSHHQGSSAYETSSPRRNPANGKRLSGKIAIVTGAGSGIGRACAIAFVREGARVALVGRRRIPLEEVAREIGSAAFVCPGDVSDKNDIERIVRETVAHFGGLNVLVNNAGKLVAGTAESHTEEEWDATQNTNVRGVWLLSKAVLPHMRKSGGGSIINISSVLGLVGAKNRVAYAASKGAVTLMSKAMALDHAPENIRVNAICPGIVETELVSQFITNAPDPEAARKHRVALHPMGRFGKPEDIAYCAVYLASDECAWVTGAAFPVDGGYSAV